MKNPAARPQGIKHQENTVIPRLVRGIQKQKNWILWSSQRMTLQGNPVARPQGIYKLKIGVME